MADAIVEPIRFSKWKGHGGIENYIIEQTGCKPYIFLRKLRKITVNLRINSTVYFCINLIVVQELTQELTKKQPY